MSLGALHLALHLPLFELVALVEGAAALAEPKLDLGKPVSEIDVQRHQCQTLLGHLADEPLHLALPQQQLAPPFRVVPAGPSEAVWSDVEVLQPQLSPR